MSDLDWDDWMELTDAQQDAIVSRAMAELERRLDAMSIPQQVAHHRHFALQSILDNRRRLRDLDLRNMPFIEKVFRDGIRLCQVRLLKLRIWRSTGIYPGSTS